jgi:hypothetical protein
LNQLSSVQQKHYLTQYTKKVLIPQAFPYHAQIKKLSHPTSQHQLIVFSNKLNIIVKMSLRLTYSNSIKIAIKDKPSGGASVLYEPRQSHRFGGDWVTNEEVVSGVILS